MRIFKKHLLGPKKKKRKKIIPDGLWSKCPGCSHLIFHKVLEDNLKVCSQCNYHFLITSTERIQIITDQDSFLELYPDLTSCDPLEFKGPKSYLDKLKEDVSKTKLNDAVLVGEAKIEGIRCSLGVTDSRFIMGSMGSVVGEKVTRITEHAIKERLPLIIVSGSGGGARMYEGMLSLMQMAKTSGALQHLRKAKLPFISVLTHPTMAGVFASFAGLGDIMIAEPGALVGFAGPRVIKQTIQQDLPQGFQTAEFTLEHGFMDMIVNRKELKAMLAKLLAYLTPNK